MDYIMLQKFINIRMVALEPMGTHWQLQMVQGSMRLQGNNGFVLTLTDLVKSPDSGCRQTWFKSCLCHFLAVSSSVK